MASQTQVKQYLAYWFQLGKQVLLHNGSASRLPQPVIQGDRYSRAFEECWNEILSPESGDCYLQGMEQSINELLSSEWDIEQCSRCSMPVPLRTVGMPPDCCPCFDLPTWPNMEAPLPRLPVSTRLYLLNICNRLIDGTETHSE